MSEKDRDAGFAPNAMQKLQANIIARLEGEVAQKKRDIQALYNSFNEMDLEHGATIATLRADLATRTAERDEALKALAAARADARLRCDIMCDLAYAHGVQAGQIIPDCDVAAKERLRLAMERRVTEALRARSALAWEG